MTTDPTPLRDAALALAARGWPVFPCMVKGKTPLTIHGLKDASSHREHVWQWWTRWPTANIGLVAGPTSGLYVVDLDGPQGRESWEKLTAEHGKTSTLVAITGGLGVHAIFTYPEGAELGNTAGRLGPGIDTRGQGGYIIAPPSPHAAGRPYRWLGSCAVSEDIKAAQAAFWRAPAPIPEWLLELLVSPPRSRPAVLPPAKPPGAGQELVDWLAKQPEGRRNHGLHWAACQACRRSYPESTFDALLDTALRIGLSEHEARQTIASARSRVLSEVS